MDLIINPASSIPLYQQIKEQIKFLIISGRFKSGDKLPSGRQLSDFLHVNRGTIINALNDLSNEGYLRSEKGRGYFVADSHLAKLHRDNEGFTELVKSTIDKCRALGFSPEELITAIYALSLPADAGQQDFYGVFVECNRPVLDSYQQDLEKELGIPVHGLLMEQLDAMESEVSLLLRGAGVVITTFTHFHEVKRILRDFPVEVVGVTAGPYLDLLLQVSQLSAEDTIAVVMVTRRGAHEVAQSIRDAGIKHQNLSTASLDDENELKRVVAEAEHIVVSAAIEERVKRLLNEKQRVYTYQNTLDRASIQMLKHMLPELKHQYALSSEGREIRRMSL